MKKKIIFITEALWIGGIETALVNLLNRMDYKKYDVTCLVLRRSLEMAARITQDCRLIVADRDRAITFSEAYRYSRLYHLTEESTNPSWRHHAMMWTVPAIRWVENRLYIRYIRKQMSGERFDTCVIYSDRAAETAVRAIRADRFLLFYHHGAMRKAYHDEIGYRRSEKIITVSERTEVLLKAYRYKYADKIMVLHNVVDIETVTAKSRQTVDVTFSAGDFNLVSCGRLTEAKGIDWAIWVMRKLLDLGYTDVHWWVVGGGPDEVILKKQAETMAVCENFHFLGMQDNPYPYIAKADLYVQPSRYENYSMVILEAMVLCKPILATNSAAEMQITSGINGMLCQATPVSIADAIMYLYQNRDVLKQYAESLRDNNLESHNEEIIDNLCRLCDGE